MDMPKYTFIYEDEVDEGQPVYLEMSFHEEFLDRITDKFRDFLQGVSFSYVEEINAKSFGEDLIQPTETIDTIIEELEYYLKPEDTGHIHTTINTLKQLKEGSL